MKDQLALANRSRLRDALHLLRKFLMARSAEPLLNASDLAPLEALVRDESYYSASIPRVLLLGKFKAGKSTLVNALLEVPLAATDLFEMTAWLARYWPPEDPFCRIISRSGYVTETTPLDFVARCQSRQFSKDRLADIAAIDIGTGPSGLAVTLIDAPGSGGMNRDNEKRLVEALQDADLVMWVADVTALGDARESALVQKLREQDTPIVVVLTKCDFAGEDEIDEAKAFVVETYGLEDVPILATAAGAPGALGVDRLRSFLNSEVATRHSELRARAQQAHEERIAELARRLLDQVHGELAYWSQNVRRFVLISRDMCESVQSQLEIEIEHFVRTKLFGDRRDQITAAMQNSLADGKGALSQERISEIFSRALGANYLDEFWKNLLDHVRGAGSSIWKDKIKDRIRELEECCGAFKDDVIRHIGVELNDETIRVQAGELALQQAGTVMSGTAVTAAIGTAAAMGKATFAAAVTGVGLPIAATGAVLAGTVYFIQRQRAMDAIRAQAHTYLDQCVDAFLRDVVRKQFFPQLRDVNACIAGEMVEAFKDGIAGRLPEGDLEQMLNDVAACRAAIR